MKSTIVDNVSNWPEDLLRKPKRNPTFTVGAIYDESKGFLIILVALSILYGGIHLATWNFAFPSKTEHLLWKIACIDIMVTAPIEVFNLRGSRAIYDLAVAFTTFEARRSARKRDIVELFSWSLYSLSHFLLSYLLNLYALLTCYALSRIYIVVESFVSLRHVPIGVYAAVPWVQAIPHI